MSVAGRIIAVQEACTTGSSSLSLWGPALIALFGVLLTLLFKWWTDRRAEHRRAAAELAGALAELGMNRDEVVRLGLREAFKMYEEAAKKGEIVPLFAPLKEEMFPVARKSLESVGVLGRSATADLTAIYFRATAVISTMKSIQATMLASSEALERSRRDAIIGTLYELVGRQVEDSVKEFDLRSASLLEKVKSGQRW